MPLKGRAIVCAIARFSSIAVANFISIRITLKNRQELHAAMMEQWSEMSGAAETDIGSARPGA